MLLVAVVACVAYFAARGRDSASAVEPSLARSEPGALAPPELAASRSTERAVAQTTTKEDGPAAAPTNAAKRRAADATIRLLTSGEPLRQGRVVLTPLGGSSIAAQVDPATGEARFTGLPIRTYGIALEGIPEGWLVARATARDERRNDGGREIALKPGENRLDIELEAGAVVVGVVFDEKGWPEQDATVRISSLEGRERYVPSRDVPVKDGGFRACVHPGLSAIEVMGAGGRVPPLAQRVDLAAGGRADLEFYFQVGSETLVGRIVDETGAPFAGLRIGLTCTALIPPPAGSTAPPQEIRQGLQSTKSDAAGGFVFEKLPRGTCAVHVEQDGYSPFGGPGESIVGRVQEARTIELPRADTEPWTIVVERAHPVLVRGKVLVKRKGEVSSIEVVLAAGTRRAKERRQSFDVGFDGSFQFHVDGAETGAAIELKRDGRVVRVPLAVTLESGGPFLEIPLP